MNQSSPIIEAANAPSPERFCDVVMKGGITSGVVYPLAIARLAERFRLKNIGGTSAGAIAAAAAAAAELGRSAGGYDRLKKLPDFLGCLSPDGKNSNLFTFFQPQPKTRPLFKVAVSALGGGPTAIIRVCWAAIIQFPLAALLGAVPALCLFVGAWSSTQCVFFWICMVAVGTLLVVGIAIGLAVAIVCRMSTALPKNFYGLCSGMTEEFYDTGETPPSRDKPLTFWLWEYINGTAGREEHGDPLTFRDLWGTNDPNADRKINLEMMTTCVTHGRPYRLPFRDDNDLNENQFYFCQQEFERLFPKRVVDWMATHPRDAGKGSKRAEVLATREELAKRGLHPMPAPADLPVVVAVRMSLSFPILLSAIPLYSVDRDRDPDGKNPEPCWFSDGGVCSNFPLHFFDAALPRRPTLSINLSEEPEGTESLGLEPKMVEYNHAGIQEHWNRFDSEKCGLRKIAGFVGAIIGTMQNWTDNTQSRLPGFRDRIVHVPLTSNEGGLNLNMPKERIRALAKRGERAGEKLLNHFAPPCQHPRMTWDNHRWLRMRSMMASLEKMLKQVDNACANPEGNDTPYDQWIKSGVPKPRSYRWANKQQHQQVEQALSVLRQAAQAWQRAKTMVGDSVSAANKAPRPHPELRPRAQI